MMDTRRRDEKTRINTRMREIASSVKHSQETIGRYKYQDGNRDYFNTQTEKLTEKILGLNNELTGLNHRLDDLDAGVLDQELEIQAKKITAKIQAQDQETRKKKKSQEAVQKPPAKPRFFYNNTTNENPAEKWYQKYLGICDSIPDYMLKNLDTMPSNKGYVWKGCWCFGSKPPEKGEPILVFEKCRGEMLIIHEITSTDYNVYHKQGKDRKILVEQYPKSKRK